MLGRLPRRLAHGDQAELVEHLGELRARLLISLAAIAGAFAFTFAIHERLVELLMHPLPDGKQLITLGVAEPFTTSVKVSLYAAFALALPVVLYQLWAFLAPAVERQTQRILSVFVTFATALFAAGVAFGYFVVLPRALTFLTEFDAHLYDTQLRASYYLSFVAFALVALGLAFELPVFILALVRLRVLTSQRLRRNRRLAVLLIVAAAVLLPTVDPVSLALEILPLLALFELSIWLAVVMERRWARAERLATEAAGVGW